MEHRLAVIITAAIEIAGAVHFIVGLLCLLLEGIFNFLRFVYYAVRAAPATWASNSHCALGQVQREFGFDSTKEGINNAHTGFSEINALDIELLPRLDSVHLPEFCRQDNLALGRDGSLHPK